MIEGCCNHAAGFASGLKAAGYQVLNEVVLNQVLVKFGSHEQTRRIIRHIQEDGTCWCGETKWQGHVAMRISVSSWATTAEDVSQSLAAIIRIAKKETGGIMGTSRGESVSATQVSDTEPDRPAKSAGNHPEKVKAVGYE